MEEKRIAPRLEEENEVTISVISKRKNLPKEKSTYNYSEDISASGAKIKTNILLPVDTLLNIDFTLKNLQQKINAIGKVKWIKIIIECLHRMDERSKKGFSFNMLTKYSDADKMRPDLYYGDPLFFFDYCKQNFSRNVSLLHDYNLYDFTILVRKG